MPSPSRLGAFIHLITPPTIVLVALAYHGFGRPVPVLTLVTLISGAYGKALWHDFLASQTLRGTVTRGESSQRDVILGVEPTR